MDLILGIDQGATKTAVAVMDNTGVIHGCGMAEGAYFPEDGLEIAISRVDSLVRYVLAEAFLSPGQIVHTVAGITGIDYPNDEHLVSAKLREILGFDMVEAHNDCIIAMYSGTQKRFGAALCAGTGINAAFIREDGRQFVMSDYLGEELQGGSALAYRALRRVFDSDLGMRPRTELTQLFLDFTGAASPYDMLRESIVRKETFRSEITSLVPQIIGAAENGDQVTIELLDDMARELCDYFAAGLKRMDMLNAACDIVLAGSVFKGMRNRLMENTTRRLSEIAPLAKIVNAKYEPVVGACIMGLLRVGNFTELTSSRLENSAREFGLLRVDQSQDADFFLLTR